MECTQEKCRVNDAIGTVERRTVHDCPDRTSPEEDLDFLYNADPTCEHNIVPAPGGGVKCTKCGGWFAY